MSKSLRWGILGTGNIARQFTAGLATSRRTLASAVGSRSAESARQFAAAYQIPHVFPQYESLIASDEVDAVYVSLPNSMHHQWTLRALDAGKHVLCEKPLSNTMAESQEMFDRARQRGLVLIEGFMYRTHPLTHAVLDVVRHGEIGQLRLVRTSFCYRTNRIEGNIRFDRTLAGGALMDIGCYCISLSRLAAGSEPVSFHASSRLHSSGIDEVTVGTMTFADGLVASFTCGMSVQADNTAYLCGTDGYVEIPVPWKPPRQRAAYTVARSTPPRMDNAAAQSPAAPPRETRFVDAPADLYALEADAFAECVMDGSRPFMSAEETIGNIRVLEGMRRQIGIL